MPHLQPWVVDANQLHIATDIEDFRKSFFLETDQTKRFLDASSKTREQKFIISAPKGFGKTLLLKCKYFAVRKEREDYLVLPLDFLIDKPLRQSPIDDRTVDFSKYQNLSYWIELWENAICLSTINYVSPEKLLSKASEFLVDACDLGLRRTAMEIFDLFLRMEEGRYQKVREELGIYLSPLYRSLHRKIAIFIDNVDDYFFPNLYESLHQKQGRNIWVLGQMGLVEAIRILVGTNPHAKIFASIRAEALMRGYEMTPNVQQIKGITIELSYTDEELKQIFLRNVERIPRVRKARRHNEDPISLFIGSHNRRIRHKFTGAEELFLDFLVRHTLKRPRDLMEIGAELSTLSMPYKTQQIKEAVFEGAKNSIRTFKQAMRPLIPIPTDMIFKLINKNVLAIEDLREISRKYNNHLGIYDDEKFHHPFCALYRLGLIGRLHGGSTSTGIIQKFPSQTPSLRMRWITYYQTHLFILSTRQLMS